MLIRHGKVSKEYIYLGNLAYITHDTSKEKPVHFVWKIINWSQDTIDKLKEIGIEVTKENQQNKIDDQDKSLIKVNPPQSKSIINERKQNGDYHDGIVYKPDYFAIQKKKVKIGELGEQLVYENETQYLKKSGFPELAKNVRKMSDHNDKLGYDIMSYNTDGSKKLIEVKTTTGGKGLGFHISANEVKVSNENPDDYYIYRVFDYNELTNTAKYYVVQGSVADNFNLIATEYKAVY